MAAIHKAGVPLTVLGSGSNVLVLDGGIRGVVLSLSDMRETMAAIDGVLTISAGYMLKDASEFAYAAGLTGLEFAIGIPGTLGGAVFMNAGAYGGEMCQVVTKVRAVDMAGQVREYSAEELAFAYRHSRFHESHEIIGEVDIRLKDGDKDEILASWKILRNAVRVSNPLNMPVRDLRLNGHRDILQGRSLSRPVLRASLWVMRKCPKNTPVLLLIKDRHRLRMC